MNFKLPSQKQIKEIFFHFPTTIISAFLTMFLILSLIEIDDPNFEYFEEIIKIIFVLGIKKYTMSIWCYCTHWLLPYIA